MKLKFKMLFLIVDPMLILILVLSTLGFTFIRNKCFINVENGMEAAATALSVSTFRITDDFAFLASGIQATTEYQYVVSDKNGNVVATSISDYNGVPLDFTHIDKSVYTGSRKFTKKQKINGNDYTTLIYPTAYSTIMVAQRYNDAVQSSSNIFKSIMMLDIGVTILAVIISMWLANIITKSINDSADALDKIARGDLNSPIRTACSKRKDETGMLMRSIINLRNQMREVIGAIVEQGEAVVSTAEKINEETSKSSEAMSQVDSVVAEISNGSTYQANETQNASDNVKIMGDMIQQTLNEVANLDIQTQKMNEAGRQAMSTLENLQRINVKTGEAIDTIFAQTNTTNESALRIREATEMITNISEETNLLSLNASIEAARAGEMGRGFAVVANQIQKLAEQSDNSAREIAEIVGNLLDDSEKAVETMNDVKAIIGEQTVMVESTSDAFGKVRDGIALSSDGVARIEEMANKLDSSRTVVTEVVTSLSSLAQENAASTEQTSASVSEVTGFVNDIANNAGLMKQFAKDLMNKTSVYKL